MNTDAIRHFYDYHFAENRRIWDSYIRQLTYAQFTQPLGYSTGSIRDQMVHLMECEETWFSDLRNGDGVAPFPAARDDDRAEIRVYWDKVEESIRGYLAGLEDEMLDTKPLTQEEDKDLLMWQVLLHVANHGTDHRAQVLHALNDMGLETTAQDYIFYVYDHPI